MKGNLLFLYLRLVAGLVFIPAIDQAQARSGTAFVRNKGQQGDLSSDLKRQGNHQNH